ncbi:sialate O-acetylesterase [Granulicella arctica]|uniref:sialate O-acetylesterase n=1 Tax=Granulicella arctica TaxID=940613 RepID=UPI0021DFF271|nr:sialate O-acetylesterase [Granulicella arctica]
MKRVLIAVFLTASFSATAVMAEISLPKILSSHMVLQRDKPLHIWGSGTPGEAVSVTFHNGKGSAVVDELGRWSVELPVERAGGPYTLTVKGTNTIALEDILVGDLWFASGQSNMEMPLKGFGGATVVKDAEREIREANHPNIRLLKVDLKAATYPMEDVLTGTAWVKCTPETAKDFSAVAYFFGRSIEQHEKVPIGLIDSSWGGTPAEAWTSLEALGSDASLMPVFAARAAMMDREATVIREDAADARAKAEGRMPPTRGWHPNPVSYEPGGLYNAMVAPFTPLPIRGVIWYQGETNSALNRAPTYDKLFPALIEDWRKQWRDEEMPFLFVQLAAFTSTPLEDWPMVREAQRRTLKLRNTGMAVTIDVGQADNVHPPDKETVGERLALWARSISYGERVEASGPVMKELVPRDSGLMVLFDHAAGLNARGGAVTGLEVAGPDRIFVPAAGKLEGEALVVTSPTVATPVYVRYAWKNFPEANLYNGAGLPASPFTSMR